jgi:hypothetical protein
MPNKDLGKYNKGASSLPMKAKGKAPFFFHFFVHFFVAPRNIGGSKNIYIFLGEGGNFEKIL